MACVGQSSLQCHRRLLLANWDRSGIVLTGCIPLSGGKQDRSRDRQPSGELHVGAPFDDLYTDVINFYKNTIGGKGALEADPEQHLLAILGEGRVPLN